METKSKKPDGERGWTISDTGCLIWIIVVLAISAWSGYLIYKALLGLMWATWLTITLSVVAGVIILIGLGIISFVIAIATDKSGYNLDY